MSNSYKYLDPDFTYTDPETGLLRNLQDIIDPDVLLFVESGAVTKRLQELYENPVKIKDIDNLFKIHRHLFQDIYVWAGKKRTVEINKDGKQLYCMPRLRGSEGEVIPTILIRQAVPGT